MGRRKIEIQPITQERNRSVTFLKRKNGLFKKAYELGVLCSVDVAVIVFETRPGHDAKLHLYSSTNIRNIVQRQIQHQGEEDIKGPADFSGAGGATGADDGGDDDAAGNDEDAEEVPPIRRSKRRRSGGLTMSEVMNPNENDYLSPGNQHSFASGNYLPQFPPPPMHAGRLEPSELAGMGSLLPVSNDRDSIMSEPHPRHSKRHRRTTLDSMNPGDRSPALQPGGRNSSMIGDRPPAAEQYRDPERFYPQMRASPFHDPAPYAYNAQHSMHHPGFNPNPSYTPMYSGYAQNSPPPSFVPVNAAYGAPRGGHSSFSHEMGPAHPQGGNAGAGTLRDAGERFSAAPLPQYDPSLFHPPTGMEPPRHLPADDQGNKRAVDERDGDRSRAGDGGPSSGGSAGIDWPSYRHGYIPPTVSPALRGDGGSRPLGGHGSTSQPAVAHPGDSANPNSKDSWLDDFAPAGASNAPREMTTSRPSTAGAKSAHSEIHISREGSETGADKSSEGTAGRRKGRKDKGKDAEPKDDKVKEEGGGNGEPAKKV